MNQRPCPRHYVRVAGTVKRIEEPEKKIDVLPAAKGSVPDRAGRLRHEPPRIADDGHDPGPEVADPTEQKEPALATPGALLALIGAFPCEELAALLAAGGLGYGAAVA